MLKLFLFIILFLSFVFSKVDFAGKLIFVIISEELSQTSEVQKFQIERNFHSYNVSVHIASEKSTGYNFWIYLPLIKRYATEDTSWLIFLDERTMIDFSLLKEHLLQFDDEKAFFLGRGLHDSSPTIIHHFDDSPSFLYPDKRAGFAISSALIHKLIKSEYSDNGKDFSIDAVYEFSKIVFEVGVKLYHSSSYCIEKKSNCATWFKLLNYCEKVPKALTDEVHIAVKTCSKLAQERLPVLIKTWLKNIPSFGLYSDRTDKELGTLSIGIPNTDRGHCGKTMAILKKASKMKHMKWLVIVDDDTLLSINRLSSFINCFNSSNEVAAGERYGFRTEFHSGFNYLTGGSGMIFSSPLVKRLSEQNTCSCPSNDSPDDMVLGACLKRIAVPITHSARFHQARPEDYPSDLLRETLPISFHKFWMINPIKEYDKWLSENSLNPHLEL